MQFIRNGPEIPEDLLEAHEEGRVVFFCGAGISYPAQLPGFGGLVNKIYGELNVDKSDTEESALKNFQFDTALGLLERRHPSGRIGVRSALAQSLKPDLSRPKAEQTHEALLTLCKSRSGYSRLITTNFDRVFENIKKNKNLKFDSFAAPFLPVPKSRWNGLVYLHGLLMDQPTNDNLNSLIVSSGDFGLAYLTERWAARFVGELFRNYTVCFVGYSINDPILRYMMDALAADALMGETSPKAFAFGSHSKGQEKKAAQEWEAKNVTPILYREYRRHYYLHETLHAWAENYRDGVDGKQAIVAKHARTKPMGSTRQDDFVRRMIWALSDSSGLPAKHFAESQPAPSIEWLEVLSNDVFGHGELSRFGVTPNKLKDDKLKFSLLQRPAPYSISPPMSLVARKNGEFAPLDNVMKELSRWLARHLERPELLFWVIKQGAVIHPQFSREIKEALRDINPANPIHKLWRLILSGRIRTPSQNSSLFHWKGNLNTYGVSPLALMELKEALKPHIELSEPFRWPGLEDDDSTTKMSGLARVEIGLNSDDAQYHIQELEKVDKWKEILQKFLPYSTDLLEDAMDLMFEAEIASEYEDYSYIHQPSIAAHKQNNDFNDWTVLIELCRDSWIACAEKEPETAKEFLERWVRSRYPVFRRLVFFAATQMPDLVDNEKALKWLLSDDGRWLWAITVQRETIRLIVSLATDMSEEHGGILQKAILAGPPKDKFYKHLKEHEFNRITDRMKWLRLKKFVSEGGKPIHATEELLNELESRYPSWTLADDERDEFPFWSSNGEDSIVVLEAPSSPEALAKWLQKHPSPDDVHERDNWSELCAKDFRLCADALIKLARVGCWPVGRWRQALQTWATGELAARSWKLIGSTVCKMPVATFNEINRTIAWWIKSNSSNIAETEQTFFDLIWRIVEHEKNQNFEVGDDVVGLAINHPIGLVTEAALNWWFGQGLEDDQKIDSHLRLLFDEICRDELSAMHYGKVILGGNLVTLFRVDSSWTKKNLVPFFDWANNPNVALGMWQSFLHSPRLYWPLISCIKEYFLEIPKRYDALGDRYSGQFTTFLTYAALAPDSPIKKTEYRLAFSQLPNSALSEVADTLYRAEKGAGDQKLEYFTNRIRPFFKSVWPQRLDARTEKVSQYLAQLCAVSGEAFPEAIALFRNWLIPTDHFTYTAHLLNETDLPSLHPKNVIELLNYIVPDEPTYLPEDLSKILERAVAAEPELRDRASFRQLSILVRKQN